MNRATVAASRTRTVPAPVRHCGIAGAKENDEGDGAIVTDGCSALSVAEGVARPIKACGSGSVRQG